jgi:integrase
LRNLDLRRRPPYQMRHTAATMMLAAGENPEWVASVLGHTTTEMLFRVYSRFVPNLTRNDGLAFAGLVNSQLGASVGKSDSAAPTQAPAQQAALDAIKALTPAQLAALVALATKKS